MLYFWLIILLSLSWTTDNVPSLLQTVFICSSFLYWTGTLNYYFKNLLLTKSYHLVSFLIFGNIWPSSLHHSPNAVSVWFIWLFVFLIFPLIFQINTTVSISRIFLCKIKSFKWIPPTFLFWLSNVSQYVVFLQSTIYNCV